FVQSEVPAIDELTFFFSMLIPFNRVMRNPTLKDEIRDKELGENYPFGFPLYAVGQTADILAFRPAVVPVGEDQLPHLELTREVARRFDQMYCGVSPHTEDKAYVKAGGLFPIIEAKLGRVTRLVGTGGDVPVKRKLVEVLNQLLEPIRQRRRQYEQRPDDVLSVLREGTKKANAVAEETLALAKKAMKQDYFSRALSVQ